MHVLDKFRYCPVCGSADFEPSTVKSKRCRHCGFEYFLNPSAANAALIMNGRDELLVITRKNDPAKGTLDLPGGFYDMNETAEQGLAREVKEETASPSFPHGCSSVTPIPISIPASPFTRSTSSFSAVWKTSLLCRHTTMQPVTSGLPSEICVPKAFGLDSIRRAVTRFQQDFEAGKLGF